MFVRDSRLFVALDLANEMHLARNIIPGKIQFTSFCLSQSLEQLTGVKYEKVKIKNILLS